MAKGGSQEKAWSGSREFMVRQSGSLEIPSSHLHPNFKIITIDLLKRFYLFLLLLFLNCQSSMARKWTEISVFPRAIYNHKKLQNDEGL